MPTDAGSTPGARPHRADARRNRARVLDVAMRVFAEEGLAVPVHEIARRSGVSTGTVSRHFPTKESLYDAIIANQIERLVDRARSLAATEDPGTAFFSFFTFMIAEGATNRGIADALAGGGYDLGASAARTGHDVMAVLADLLEQAQRTGAVRDDVDVSDIKALMIGCQTRERETADPRARERITAVIIDGLRATPPEVRGGPARS